MKQSTYIPISQARGSSSGTADVQTLIPPADASACEITVETTNARMTVDGSTPSVTNGHVFPKDQLPHLKLIGPGSSIKWISIAAAASVVNVTWYR